MANNIFPSVNGAQIVIPGVYGSVTSSVQFTQSTGNGPLVFIAQSYGVEPNTPTLFTDPQSLTQAMRGAPSAQYVPFFFNPSSEMSGATQVYLINVSPSLQSTASIIGTLTAGDITLTSANYGSPSNLLYYSLSQGSIQGYSLTITDKYSGQTVSGDNLGYPFGITYTGTATGVTYQVDNTSPYPTFVLTSSNQGESFSFVLNPESFPTITSLVNTINGLGMYSAYVLSSSAGLTPANVLDISSGPVTVGTNGTYTYVPAFIGDVVAWVNNFAQGLVTASPTNSGPYFQAYALTLDSNVQFTGASNGVPTSTNYADALQSALTIPASVVFIDNNEQSIVSLALAHVQAAASTGTSLPRRYVTGPSLGASVSTALQLAASLNTSYATVAYPGGYSAVSGVNTLYSSLTTAAMYAGMMAGNVPRIPLTNKTINYTALETNLSVSQIESLQSGGVMCAYLPASTKLPTIATDVTTWLNSDNPSYIYNQQVALSTALLENLISNLQSFVGSDVVSTNITGGQIRNRILRAINRVTGTIVSPGYPVNVSLSYNQLTESWSVKVGVVLLAQTRYIILSISLNPQSSQVTASVT